MFGLGKKTLLIAAGYLIGGAVATLYGEKKGKKIRDDLDEVKGDSEKTNKIMINNFVETHKNFAENLKERFLTEENKEIFSKKVDKAKDLVKSYKKDGEKLIEELKEKGLEYAETAKEELENLYETKKEDLKNLQNKAPEKIEKVKEKLLSKFDEVKEKIKK